MIDPRFFTNAGPFTLGDLADRLGGKLADRAPRDFVVTDLAMLQASWEKSYRAWMNEYRLEA